MGLGAVFLLCGRVSSCIGAWGVGAPHVPPFVYPATIFYRILPGNARFFSNRQEDVSRQKKRGRCIGLQQLLFSRSRLAPEPHDII